jgi:hypothetical protein
MSNSRPATKDETMVKVPERITIRLGSLRAPLERYCGKHKLAPTEAGRRALAELLGKKVPEMPEGNPDFKKQKKKA